MVVTYTHIRSSFLSLKNGWVNLFKLKCLSRSKRFSHRIYPSIVDREPSQPSRCLHQTSNSLKIFRRHTWLSCSESFLCEAWKCSYKLFELNVKSVWHIKSVLRNFAKTRSIEQWFLKVFCCKNTSMFLDLILDWKLMIRRKTNSREVEWILTSSLCLHIADVIGKCQSVAIISRNHTNKICFKLGFFNSSKIKFSRIEMSGIYFAMGTESTYQNSHLPQAKST